MFARLPVHCVATVMLALGLLGLAPEAKAVTPLATCVEVTEGGLEISIDSHDIGVVATFSDGRHLSLTLDESRLVWTAAHGHPMNSGYFSFEVGLINTRHIGVLYEIDLDGPGMLEESIFRCLDIGLGAASSNGG